MLDVRTDNVVLIRVIIQRDNFKTVWDQIRESSCLVSTFRDSGVENCSDVTVDINFMKMCFYTQVPIG